MRRGLAGAERLRSTSPTSGPQLFDWSSSRVREAVEGSGPSLVVVASPDLQGQLHRVAQVLPRLVQHHRPAGVTVVPVMIGAGLQHALAVEVHLRPVLVELGASLPTRGLYVSEDQLDGLDGVVAEWVREAGPALRATMSGRVGPSTPRT